MKPAARQRPSIPVEVGQERAPAPRVTATAASRERPRARLLSLDAFRGLTILGMLLVNNTALDTATPAQLSHAPWDGGVHFADLVFPWFLLIVGVAIPYSAASQRTRALPSWRRHLKILGRAGSLVLLGCLVSSSSAGRPVFYLGVLQLIGLAYLVGALLYRLPTAARLTAVGVLLVGHWAALRFVPVPGLGVGVFREQANLVQYLNDLYLRPLHLQGIISVIPTAALVLIGTAVGDLFRRDEVSPAQRFAYLVAGGSALALTGWLWSFDLPFNKPLWTSSYILLTAGLGCIALAGTYAVADILGWSASMYPLVVPGTNAIFAYVMPILAKVYILQGWHLPMPGGEAITLQQAYLNALIQVAGRIGGGSLYTVSFIAFWWLVLAYMHRRRVFLRV